MPQCVIGNVKIHNEIPLILITGSVKTNLIIFRTCYVTLGYNKSECALLGSQKVDNKTAELEKMVEPYSAVVNMVHSLIEAVFSTIICLFVGSWSDKFGRKPFLVIPVIGFLLSYLSYAVFAALENVSPWYSLICSIPVCLTGGAPFYLTVLLCYITDVTEESNRGMKMGFFEGVLAVGVFLGNITSSYAFAATNYWTIMLIAAACCILSLLFTVVFIPESLPDPKTEGRFRYVFQFSNIKEMIETTFRRRPGSDRCVVLSCVFMLTLYIIVINGEGVLSFLYVREKFNWSLKEFTLYSSAQNVTSILGTIIGIYFLHKLLKIQETVMIVIGFTSMFMGMLIMGLAKYNREVYAAAFSKALGGVINPMERSLVSKIVPNKELGKIFSLIMISQLLFGMAGSSLFTMIYNKTISTDASLFNFVAAGFYLVEILIAIWILFVWKCRHSEYEEIVDEEKAKDDAV